MKYKTTILAALAIGTLNVSGLEFDRQLELDSSSLDLLFVDAGAGYIKVTGEEGLDRILVDANVMIKASSDEDAEEYVAKALQLSLDRVGDKAVLRALMQRKNSWWGSDYREYRIDLDIRMPAELALQIDDGSGPISVSNIHQNVSIDDGSGDITLRDLGKDLHIDDGSGGIDLRNLGGDLFIDDGSGSIEIVSVGGEVRIEDGSGDLELRDVAGDVDLDDGSGDILVVDLQQDLVVDGGSGDVKTRNVAGKITHLD